ncbi:MAG: hypothetical protein OXR73_18335, partial [Myxococcales bacterium]|nr:hypothetical protein [Myxococcales bacterium]
QEVPDQEVPDQEVPDQEVPDQEVPDQEVPDQEVPDQEVPDQEVSDQQVPDQASMDLARSPGCGAAPSQDDAVSSDALGRDVRGSYLLDLPVGYQSGRPYPLLLAFHAARQTASEWRDDLDIRSLAGDGAIIAYLDGDSATWDVARDLANFDTLLSQLLARYCVDPTSIFLVGHGSGALLGSMLACQRGDRLRAAALFSPVPPPGQCQGELGVLIGQGVGDASYRVEAALDARDFWAIRNRCIPASLARSAAGCVEYTRCDTGSVRYCEHDGGAGLPASAASSIWEFFMSQ